MPTITVSREALLPALTLATKVGERRTTVPILGNVKLDAAAGRLTVTRTDLDLEIAADLACEHEGDVSVTMPAQQLADIVRKLPEGAGIALTDKGANWQVTAGRSRFTLPVLPADDFPLLSAGDGFVASFTLPAATLASLIAATRFAISTEETRFYLNGIYLHRTETGDGTDLLMAVATDGHRLARFPLPLPEGAADTPAVIVPRQTVEAARLLAADKGEVTISVSETRIMLSRSNEAGTVTLTSKLVDGTYPDYQRAVPAGNGNRFRVGRKQMAEACDRVLTIAAGKVSAMRFGFGEQLTLSGSDRDSGGSAEESLPVERLDGDPVEIGFNGRYCLDILAAMDCDAAIVELGDAGAPALIRPDTTAEPAPSYALMPMRL